MEPVGEGDVGRSFWQEGGQKKSTRGDALDALGKSEIVEKIPRERFLTELRGMLSAAHRCC